MSGKMHQYSGSTIEEALQQATAELGRDITVVRARRVTSKRTLGFGSKVRYEVDVMVGATATAATEAGGPTGEFDGVLATLIDNIERLETDRNGAAPGAGSAPGAGVARLGADSAGGPSRSPFGFGDADLADAPIGYGPNRRRAGSGGAPVGGAERDVRPVGPSAVDLRALRGEVDDEVLASLIDRPVRPAAGVGADNTPDRARLARTTDRADQGGQGRGEQRSPDRPVRPAARADDDGPVGDPLTRAARRAAERAAQSKAFGLQSRPAQPQGLNDEEQAERLLAERFAAERQQVEALAAQRLEAERQAAVEEAARVAAEAARVEAERLEAVRAEAERAEAERLETARAEAARLEAERLEVERLAAEEAARLEAARVEAERLEVERLAAEEAARLEAERLEVARLEAERLEAELEQQRRAEQERRAAAERALSERLEAERLQVERLRAERAAEERRELERLEADRLRELRRAAEERALRELEREQEARRQAAAALAAAEAEQARLAAQRLEAERLETERLETERLETERLEAERLEAARLEAERLEAERLEAERAEQLDLERAAAEAYLATRRDWSPPTVPAGWSTVAPAETTVVDAEWVDIDDPDRGAWLDGRSRTDDLPVLDADVETVPTDRAAGTDGDVDGPPPGARRARRRLRDLQRQLQEQAAAAGVPLDRTIEDAAAATVVTGAADDAADDVAADEVATPTPAASTSVELVLPYHTGEHVPAKRSAGLLAAVGPARPGARAEAASSLAPAAAGASIDLAEDPSLDLTLGGEPQWSLEHLASMGLPSVAVEALGTLELDSDADWMSAMELFIREHVPAPVSRPSDTPGVFLSGSGAESAAAIVQAGLLGFRPGYIFVEGQLRLASSIELMLAIRSCLPR
ncbi:MAG: hypothetical protein AB7O92_06390 [Acidimicrobiia bacterium]